ncbi:MAG: dihydropteroate synthase [Candidatus Omnitrophota bacterium]
MLTQLKEKKKISSKTRLENLIPEKGKRTYVAGILNITPDSFSDGGRFADTNSAFDHALQMARDGADIIDIGGESTRPGAGPVTAEDELRRVLPVIERLKDRLKIPISIDTCKSLVAEAAIRCGASIINDITGLKGDQEMAQVAARYGIPVVVMHMKGHPRTMQNNPRYDDLITEIIENLKESIDIAKKAGMDEENIIIDPGIGFGKTLEHNITIIRELGRFKELGRPIMIGLSRKSFIGQILNRDVSGRLMGTAAAVALSILNGADIVRVHDVKEIRDATRITDSICRS